MATFGYLVYLISGHAPYRARELQRLSALGDNDHDFLEQLDGKLSEIHGRFIHEEGSAEGFRVKSSERRGRTLSLLINKGPRGIAGEAYNIETDESIETTEAQALLSGLRAMFVIPRDSYYGVLFVERIGNRHLKEVLREQVVRPIGLELGVVIEVAAFAEAKDWETLLDPQQTLSVTELLEVRDSSTDASTPDKSTVRVTAEGAMVRRASEAVKGAVQGILRRRDAQLDALASMAPLKERRASQDGFTVQDQEEIDRLEAELASARQAPESEDLSDVLAPLIPVQRPELEHKNYVVTTGVDRPERTFYIERGSLPSFVYPTNGHLPVSALRDTWVAHAQTLLRARGVSLPHDWSRA